MTASIDSGLLTRLAQLESAAALAELADAGLTPGATAAALADAALEHAETDPSAAQRWLDLADALLRAAEPETGAPGVRSQVLYARARLLVAEGDLPGAESALRDARADWLAAGDEAAFARGGLGLTTVLAIQGRYAEAEEVIRAAIDILAALSPGLRSPILLDAQHNLATLLSYRERHGEALAIHEAVRAGCEQLLREATEPDERSTLASLAVQTGLAIALAETFLDRPAAAERTLHDAISQATAAGDTLNRGRASTNLAHLYQRTGRYAEAMEQLNRAAADLLGTDDVDAVHERWPVSDVLFLEQATVYLALNLLPEAVTALRRAVQLFERTGQPYELGQALYYSGLLAGAQQAWATAAASLARAGDLFAGLQNDYWRNRVRLAQAGLAAGQGDATVARALLDTLVGNAADLGTETLRWDGPVRAEAYLLRGQLALEARETQTARAAAHGAALALGLAGPDSPETALLPQLQLRLLHLLGALEQLDGNPASAQRHFSRAVDLLESQRVDLPLEEIRSAFLADKTALYADFAVSLLDTPTEDAAGTTAAAFAVVERARARALLERLIASLEERAQGGQGQPLELSEQMAALRQRLHWLYNQLVEGGEGRHATLEIGEEIRACEATLQALEWQVAPWLRQAEPVELPSLQDVLAARETALVYFTAGAEVLAFVVKPDGAAVHRCLCQLPALAEAAAELRFQLGRVETDPAYVARHAERLLGGVRRALHRLYDLILAPVVAALPADRLLIIPHGVLHQIPFPALWDGAAYVLDRWECSVAASASMAVHLRTGPHTGLRTGRGARQGYDSLAALALRDPAIPQAEAEVRAAAACFDDVSLYLDAAADLAGLVQAAGAGAILHIATHGLFRPDNPFFSALKLADGWIDVRQIYRLPLTARLVVLSACESGAQQVLGADEVIGLARGFLGAGAEQLVVSLWNVHDASAAQLMAAFYARLTGESGSQPAAALRLAQRQAAAAGQHPYFWAPFIAIG